MRYLLDTNICIYLIKKRPKEVIERFMAVSPGDIGISTVTLFELQYGVEKSKYRKQSEEALTKFILPLTIIDLDRASAEEAAKIRARLEVQGTPIGAYDLLIAGIVKAKDLVLVTNNTAEFERIPGLRIENWVQRD